MHKTYSLHKPDTLPVVEVSLEELGEKTQWMRVMKQTLRRVHDSRIFEWEVLAKKSAVTVLPVTPDREFILIDQFRYPIMEWELECPAETMDVSGDTPESAAVRALSEEIGYRCDRLLRVATYASSGGTTDELSYGFITLGCTPIEGGQSQSADEIIRVNHIPIDAIDAFLETRIAEGQIISPKMDALIARYRSGRYS